jgi:hypothetical protein
MSRLILFSGGVESTALLTLAQRDDRLLTIEETFPQDLATFRRETARRIARHFGLDIDYARIELPITGSFVHQMRVFISVCNLWCARDPSITEVWCGRNSTEPNAHIRPLIDQMMAAWSVLHPTVQFLHPLDHLSKREQVELIPPEIRSIVSSCIYHINCGGCYKCRELR